jgi:hypothetical protein
MHYSVIIQGLLVIQGEAHSNFQTEFLSKWGKNYHGGTGSQVMTISDQQITQISQIKILYDFSSCPPCQVHFCSGLSESEITFLTIKPV